ncbi:MAG: cysteine methyltransferase [Bacteroidetes bacterium]|jgi:methylated-DNA-protein-cysteine methyltransferase-like protein|nr:cysteine methyltransferase [Bacteroidota bacterium]
MQKDYYKRIYELVSQIPEGRVTNYGAIADALALGSARTVGYALSQSHKIAPLIPAHRVVNRKGELSGRHHFSPPERMAKLLEEEGVEIQNDAVVDFKNRFWSPLNAILD